MNEIVEIEKIENLIYEIRGKQVMLDSDLAILYRCSNGTKDINKAVKRNIERFPKNFMFRLTDEEYNILRFQTGTSKIKGGRRYNPYVFTEQGVAMLSSTLRSETAVKTSIAIMNAFVAMRKYLSSNLIEKKYINNLVLEHDSEIKLLKKSFEKFDEKKKYNETFYNGQIYDAYSKIIEIFKESKKELIIIDRYADITVLDMIKNLKVKVILIIKEKGLLTNRDIEKYNSQYNNLKIIYNNDFHDRYFIIDRKEVYHCGASINHAGSRTFSINKLEDKIVKEEFIKNINNII